MNKVLIIGGGGRESALAYRLYKENIDIYSTPGNPGIFEYSKRAICDLNDFNSISDFVLHNNIDLVIIGPEMFLDMGLVDYLENKGINVFGPSKNAAKIETDKSFAKQLMKKYNVPTAEFDIFDNKYSLIEFINKKNYPYVLKVSGLAAGKGAFVINNEQERNNALYEIFEENKFKSAANKIVFEEFLKGEEASLFVITDGNNIITMLPAQDYKRVYDNDKGHNTGGMGSYAPYINIDNKLKDNIIETIIMPVLYGLKKENTPFKGLLYAGLMINDKQAKVIEFNARFGDPETQSILPLIKSNESLFDILLQSSKGKLEINNIHFDNQFAVTVVIAANGYPNKYNKNMPIIIDKNKMEDILIFHAGTKLENNKLLSNGGRILNIIAKHDNIKEAIDKVYRNIKHINIPDTFYRKDIAKRALK